MDVVPGYLNRAFTSPPSSHSRLPNSTSSSNAHPLSQYSTFSAPSRRTSDSTQDTSTSTLFPTSSPTSYAAQSNGHISPTTNVINRKADKETSLFQICTRLRNRLRGVADFEDYVLRIEDDAQNEEEPLDPVTLLWRTFRRGYPLLAIFNALQPRTPIVVEGPGFQTEIKKEKHAAYRFFQACQTEIPETVNEGVTLADLYGDDTAGFIKVVRVVSRIVDTLIKRGLLVISDHGNEDSLKPRGKLTQRQHIVNELVNTERTYVGHLELLQSFKKLLEDKGVINGDAIHNIFLNLDALLDFQRRFHIRVESMYALPEDKQNWGQLFKSYADAFSVYEPYIGNQKKCEETATREFEKLRTAGGSSDLQQIVESSTVLASFLLKPFQRLSKYPLLLRELRDKGDLDPQQRSDIVEAMNVVTAVLERTNAYIDRGERLEAVQALISQVDDWRKHKVEQFGELLLFGTYTVLKGDGMNSEREYKMYLFEKILLCCKELGQKQLAKSKYKGLQSTDKKGRQRMTLKGRIFMVNVTETIYLSKVGSYNMQIFWRGNDSIEHFTVKYPTEEQGKKWISQIETQRQICQEQMRIAALDSAQDTEFNYMQHQGVMENPYKEDDDDTDTDRGHYSLEDSSGHTLSRFGSSNSLRSRSGTAESGSSQPHGSGRAPAMRYPAGFTGAPLTLRTQHLQNGMSSPLDRAMGGSYFSPSIDSPMSSRTSSSSGMFPFPRQATPQNNWQQEDSVRYTAPAISRPLTNEAVKGQYQVDPRTGRIMPNPAIPTHPASLSQTRNRSASSPIMDISLRRPGGSPPPMPTVPSNLSRTATMDRSQNNSPIYTNGNLSLSQVSSDAQSSPDTYEQHQTVDGTSTMAPTMPTMLRVKIKVPTEGSTFVLVVAYNIGFKALRDRIDSKLQRHTQLSLTAGTAKLKYLDEDTFVSIQTDEDVQNAFESWREHQHGPLMPGLQGEVELYCHR